MPTEKRQRQKQGQQARREAALEAARRQQRKRRTITMAILVVVVFGVMALIAVTGGKDKDKTSTASTKGTSTTVAGTPTTMPKPTITVPTDPAPTTLVKKDLKEGTGAEAKDGDTVEVNYVGVTYKDGKEFDASWNRKQTFSFKVGGGEVIQGWDQGVPGMKVGGRRELIIPGSLAYGDKDNGDGRPVGTLIFIVDLVAIK